MAKQAKVTRGRPLRLATTAINGEPENGYESAEDALPLQTPHHVMSPRTQTGMITTGVIIGISQPAAGAATANAGGFEVILWVANSTGFFWYRSTSVFLNYRDASLTFDVDAAPLYVQVDPTSVAVDGNIVFDFMEV